MTQYRKRPVVIDALQLPEAGVELPRGLSDDLGHLLRGNRWVSDRDETLTITTLEGDMTAQPGDWIIRGVKGECYPCKPDVFAETYDPVEA